MPEFIAVVVEGLHLNARNGIFDRPTSLVVRRYGPARGDVSVNAPRFCDRPCASLQRPAGSLLRMQQLAIDINQRGAIVPFFDDVGFGACHKVFSGRTSDSISLLALSVFGVKRRCVVPLIA